ncbi:MAG: polyprenyl synthetase family protein [Arenicella sp.]|jgi:geranylgeranyl pyrophosphate synthase|nr:polyprenyl synthetase family protein [Arenicella sp.]
MNMLSSHTANTERASSAYGRVQASRVSDLMRLTCLSALARDSILWQAIDYHFAAPGSQSRSAIALHAATKLGLTDEDSVHLAAAIECLHNASLVQDDLQDRDPSRRGQPAVWKKFGPDLAINATDLMIASAFALVASVGSGHRSTSLAMHMQRAISLTLQGQSEDVLRIHRSEKDALAIAADKSGPLFALGLVLPLLAAGQEKAAPLASMAGRHFGVGYQLLDDLNDIEEDQKSGFIPNSVLSRMEVDTIDNARQQIALIASNHAALARDLAAQLPQDCGELFSQSCDQLIAKLRF